MLMFRNAFIALALFFSSPAFATNERSYLVAVIGTSPPMSYINAQGKLTGFNIEMAHALCKAMGIHCKLHPIPLSDVINTLARGEADFAVVSLLDTPERRQKVVFSKPYYRSVSVLLGKPSVVPGSKNTVVGAVKGSAQARYAEEKGWLFYPVTSHKEFPNLLQSGKIQAVILPMLTGISLQKEKSLQVLDLQSTVLDDPSIAGNVAISIAPKNADLLQPINAAIDQIKQDGEFDRINSRFLPFRLQ